MLGFDGSADRNFSLEIRNQQLVIVTFELSFNARTFRNNYPTNGQEFEVMARKLKFARKVSHVQIFEPKKAALSTSSLDNGLNFNAQNNNPSSTVEGRDNCEALKSDGTKLCQQMACQEMIKMSHFQLMSHKRPKLIVSSL